MSITYVVLTCNKYLETRCKWCIDSWLTKLSSNESYLFLSSKPDEKNNIVGWNTPDNYESCSRKYLEFFRNIKINSDWIVFVDDDTFVFPNRMRDMLQSYNSNEKLYIGKLLYGPIPTMSGGAGFCLSQKMFKEIQHYIQHNNIVLDTIYSDVFVGQMVQKLKGIYVWNLYFNSHPHHEEGNTKDAITFHYVTEELFKYYLQFVE